jgi:sporulation protein YlmC with PRC-barrel domain
VNDRGRVLHAGLQLLDRQLVDRHGRLAGKVDDLELSEPDEHGAIHVTAILTGPGALMLRVGRTRLGTWLRRVATVVVPGEGDDPGRIPFARVSDIGDHVTVSLDREQLASFGGERWVRDHIVSHIPGSDHRADG